MRLLPGLLSTALCAAGCTAAVSSSAYVPGAPAAAAPGLAAPRSRPVAVRFTRDPAGAEELGIVEAHGRRPVATLQALVDELRSRVAQVGGDVARVDAFETTYENVWESYTYDCGETTTTTTTKTVTEPRTRTRTDCSGATGSTGYGGGGCQTVTETEWVTTTRPVTETKHEPKTCTGQRQVEVEVLTLTGRAFRRNGVKP